MRSFFPILKSAIPAALVVLACCSFFDRQGEPVESKVSSLEEAGQAERAAEPGNEKGEKSIEVDLTEQRLRAFEGEKLVYDFHVSSGKGGKTPTGVFRLWKKHLHKDMKVELKLLDKVYYVPNVPYVMYYFNEDIPRTRGFAVHGAYWHKDFGRPVSHGCINMKIEDARELFYWTPPDLRGNSFVVESENNPGTKITLYGEAPGVHN